MRLNVFHYPIEGWTDAVVMNVLMGRATMIQLGEFGRVSYQPLAEVFRAVSTVETRHAELGEEGLRGIVVDEVERGTAQRSVEYWYPRVAASFGTVGSTRFDALTRFGLRHTPNETLMERWRDHVVALLSELGLDTP